LLCFDPTTRPTVQLAMPNFLFSSACGVEKKESWEEGGAGCHATNKKSVNRLQLATNEGFSMCLQTVEYDRYIAVHLCVSVPTQRHEALDTMIFLHMQWNSHSSVCDSSVRVTRLIRMGDMAHSYVCHGIIICIT